MERRSRIALPEAVDTHPQPQLPSGGSREDGTQILSSQTRSSRRAALVGIYAALVLVAGYALVYIPNVELVTTLLFVGGYCFGAVVGSLIAVVVSIIFSYFNPLGASPLFLFLFQIFFYPCLAILGGAIGRVRRRRQFTIDAQTALGLGMLGFCITLVFDIGSTFAMYLPIVNGNWPAVWPYWFTGIPFSIVHLASNPLIFALLLPVIANAILEYYGRSFRA
jgi:hypothetical protein